MGNILARRLFHRLEKSAFYPGRYIVLNDGNYYCDIYAGSDAEAIAIFEAGNYKPEV